MIYDQHIGVVDRYALRFQYCSVLYESAVADFIKPGTFTYLDWISSFVRLTERDQVK